jgi:hypothetical protein
MNKKSKGSLVRFINSFPKMVDVFPPPVPADKMLPVWYKDTPSYYDNDQTPINGDQKVTIKKCMAIFDSITSGYYIKSPCDIYIDTTDGKEVIETPNFPKSIGIVPISGTHDKRQMDKYPVDTEIFLDQVFRLNLVWLVSTEKGYSTTFIQPQHYSDSPFVAVSAIIDTDTYASEGLFSFFVKKNFKGFIKKGDPIMQAIPFKRQDFYSEVVSTQDAIDNVKKQRGFLRTVFNSGYKKSLWSRKVYK